MLEDIGSSSSTLQLVSTLGAVLTGVMGLQVFLYFAYYPKDALWLKLMVAWLCALCSGHQIVVTILGVHDTAVLHAGDSTYLLRLSRVPMAAMMLHMTIVFTAHLFFAYRIWVFNGKPIIMLFMLLPLTLLTQGTAVVLCVVWHRSTAPGIAVQRARNLALVSTVSNALTDVLYTALLVFLLRRQRVKGMRGSRRIVMRLSFLSSVSGAWTTMLSVAIVLALTVSSHKALWTDLSLLLGPMYGNAVLANLNVRSYIRGGDTNYMNPSENLVFSIAPIGATVFEPEDIDDDPSVRDIELARPAPKALGGDSAPEADQGQRGEEVVETPRSI